MEEAINEPTIIKNNIFHDINMLNLSLNKLKLAAKSIAIIDYKKDVWKKEN